MVGCYRGDPTVCGHGGRENRWSLEREAPGRGIPRVRAGRGAHPLAQRRVVRAVGQLSSGDDAVDGFAVGVDDGPAGWVGDAVDGAVPGPTRWGDGRDRSRVVLEPGRDAPSRWRPRPGIWFTVAPCRREPRSPGHGRESALGQKKHRQECPHEAGGCHRPETLSIPTWTHVWSRINQARSVVTLHDCPRCRSRPAP